MFKIEHGSPVAPSHRRGVVEGVVVDDYEFADELPTGEDGVDDWTDRGGLVLGWNHHRDPHIRGAQQMRSVLQLFS